jgi:Uma2 family endonuclease
MQVELPEILTDGMIRIEPATTLSDDCYWELCAANPDLRFEREPNGEIVILPPTFFETGYRNSDLIAQLTLWAKRDGRGVAVDSSTEFFLANGAARSPDAAWVLRSRLSAFTKEEKGKFLHLCPDFVVELKSPSDRLSRQKTKMQEWVENGAQLGWLIDADKRTVYVYRPGKTPEELVNRDSVAGEGPVEGFVLELGAIWEGL